MLWDKNRFDVSSHTWVDQAYQAKKFAFAADYIRFYSLYHFGGIYLDSDVQVLKSFNPLLLHQSFIGLESSGDFEAAIIGAEKGTSWTLKMLQYYEGRTFVKPNGQFDQKPLPLIVREVLDKATTLIDGSQVDIGPTIFPSVYFSPKNIHTKRVDSTQETYTIHHFDGQWVKKGVSHKVKELIHRLLLSLLGQKGHFYFISIIRKITTG
jgi:mannosyltransferase OCH1-like enzyme